jgi:hypothetical protein
MFDDCSRSAEGALADQEDGDEEEDQRHGSNEDIPLPRVEHLARGLETGADKISITFLWRHEVMKIARLKHSSVTGKALILERVGKDSYTSND